MLELIASPTSIITIALLCTGIFAFAHQTPLGAASLPCISMFFSLIAYCILPVLALANGDNGLFGLHILSLEAPHLAVALYSVGVALACAMFSAVLKRDPMQPLPRDREVNTIAFRALVAACVAALAITVALGRLNLVASETYETADDVSAYAFLNLFFTSMVPLTIVYALKDNFGLRSKVVAAAVVFIFIMTGFRYRVMLVGGGLLISYAIVHGYRIRVSYMIGALILGTAISNIIVITRKYGAGLDLSGLQDMTVVDILTSFGGEIGPVYTFFYVTATPLPDLVFFDPWLIGISRLVPSFLWPDKPVATYMEHSFSGFSDPKYAMAAGVASPQHVEMLLQFGWVGVPMLSFLYFVIACILIDRLSRRGREARIAVAALTPPFFGFYMQSRGYFMQSLSDGLFLFAPLFLMYLGQPKKNISQEGVSPL